MIKKAIYGFNTCSKLVPACETNEKIKNSLFNKFVDKTRKYMALKTQSCIK